MLVFKLEVYSHNVKVVPQSPFGQNLVHEFCRAMIKYKTDRVVDPNAPGYRAKFVKVPDCTYAASPMDRSSYSIHIGQYEEFLGYIKRCGVMEHEIETIVVPMYEPAKVQFVTFPQWTDRDYQIPIIEFCVSAGTRKVLAVQTGKGKGYLSLRAAQEIGERILVTAKGGYIPKWVKEIKEIYDIDPDRILAIKGTDKLLAALEHAKAGVFDYDIVLISLNTLNAYIRAWEQAKGTELESLYTDPRLICYYLKIGTRIGDESHLMLHAVYTLDLYSHVPKSIYLSATIVSSDALEARVHNIIFPKSIWYHGLEWHKYTISTCLYYNAVEPNKIRCTDFRKNYSHIEFEKYLLKNVKRLKKYLSMILNLTISSYVRVRKPGQRFLIFAASIELCTVITEYLREQIPECTIARYVGEDDIGVITEHDIIVSTPGSGGTAIDIPNLVRTLNTCSISSPKLNIQMLGRLRVMKLYPDEAPENMQLVCRDIPKQMAYQRQRVEQFAEKVKIQREQNTGACI